MRFYWRVDPSCVHRESPVNDPAQPVPHLRQPVVLIVLAYVSRRSQPWQCLLSTLIKGREPSEEIPRRWCLTLSPAGVIQCPRCLGQCLINTRHPRHRGRSPGGPGRAGGALSTLTAQGGTPWLRGSPGFRGFGLTLGRCSKVTTVQYPEQRSHLPRLSRPSPAQPAPDGPGSASAVSCVRGPVPRRDMSSGRGQIPRAADSAPGERAATAVSLQTGTTRAAFSAPLHRGSA
jgi:hypothetical protein